MTSSGDTAYGLRMAHAAAQSFTKLFLYDPCNPGDLRDIILVAFESLTKNPHKFPRTANEGQYRYSVSDFPGCPNFYIHYTVTEDRFVDIDFLEHEVLLDAPEHELEHNSDGPLDT